MKLIQLALCLPIACSTLLACGDDTSNATKDPTSDDGKTDDNAGDGGSTDNNGASDDNAGDNNAGDSGSTDNNGASDDNAGDGGSTSEMSSDDNAGDGGSTSETSSSEFEAICEKVCDINAELNCGDDPLGQDCLDDCAEGPFGQDTGDCSASASAFVNCLAADNLECVDGRSSPKDGACADEEAEVVSCFFSAGSGPTSAECEDACADDDFLGIVECADIEAGFCGIFCTTLEDEFGDCSEQGLAATRCAAGNDWECVDNTPAEYDFTGCEDEAEALSACEAE